MVLCQEIKLDGESLKVAEGWCSSNKWKAFISPCRRSAKSEATAGTVVFMRKHIGAYPLRGPGAEQMAWPGSIVDGWCTAVHFDYGFKGGLIVGAVYLECGVGLGTSTKN